jgi:predicted  nucleic acid-binding Zn-ribbon protein
MLTEGDVTEESFGATVIDTYKDKTSIILVYVFIAMFTFKILAFSSSEVTLQDLQRELKILQSRVNGHDDKLDQAAEKLELDYTELRDLKARVALNEEKHAEDSSELKNLKDRVDQGEEKLKATAEKLDALEESVEADRAKTIAMIADHCERLDHESNSAKSHCVLVTGSN